MCLQKKDYKSAQLLQKELKKRCPNDKVIAELGQLLPEFVAEQDPLEEEEYDEEVEIEDEDEVSEEEEGDDEEVDDKAEEKEIKNKNEYEELGDPGEGYEWASDVDSNGKVIWGEEGVDWDFYYKEDAESYHRGESTLPALLNPR